MVGIEKKTLLIALSLVLLCCLSAGCFNNGWGDAPDFTLKTVYGETFTLSDHLGKVIIIDLMATWCPPCRLQMKELESVWEEKGDEIVIVSVDVDMSETADDVIKTFEEYVDKWVFVLDNYKENVGGKYGAHLGIPRLVIIDKKGNIYNYATGFTSKEILLERIDGASRR